MYTYTLYTEQKALFGEKRTETPALGILAIPISDAAVFGLACDFMQRRAQNWCMYLHRPIVFAGYVVCMLSETWKVLALAERKVFFPENLIAKPDFNIRGVTCHAAINVCQNGNVSSFKRGHIFFDFSEWRLSRCTMLTCAPFLCGFCVDRCEFGGLCSRPLGLIFFYEPFDPWQEVWDSSKNGANLPFWTADELQTTAGVRDK